MLSLTGVLATPKRVMSTAIVSDSLAGWPAWCGTGNNPTAAARHGARMYDGGIGADLMAKVRVTHHFADNSVTDLSVKVDETFPDALDEARAQVVKLWREVCTEAEVEGP